MIVRSLVAAFVVLLISAPVPASAAGKHPDKVLLVHVTTPLDRNTDRTALVFRVVAAALKKGHRVVFFFDAEGVSSLKMGRWFGGHSTPLDRAAIREPERRDLAALLGTSADGIPDIYGSLLHFLKGRGAAVSVSKRALELRGIDADHFDHVAEPVDEEGALDLLARANAYVSY